MLKQAAPVFLGQLAVMGNSIIDTLMAGHAGSDVLAALAVGNAVYISVYIGLMGVILAITPVAAEHFGAKRYEHIGQESGQGLWLATGLSFIGFTVMMFPTPLLKLVDAPPQLTAPVRDYLYGIAFGLPAALGLRVFFAINQAISRPTVVMALQFVMLALKVPLNHWLMYGGFSIPPLGAAGCAWATAATVWGAFILAISLWYLHPIYRKFRGVAWLSKPNFSNLWKLLKVGLPIGGAYLIEVTSFTFVAILVARFGSNEVAGHQIVSNLSATAYMLPLSIGNATTVLAAQRLGAGQPEWAARYVKTGLILGVSAATLWISTLLLGNRWIISAYTSDPNTIKVALALVPCIAFYHFFDCIQSISAFALRAYQISTAPMLIFAICLWGIGLTGGIWLGIVQQPPMRAEGFWIAATIGLAIAAGWMLIYLLRVIQRQPYQQ
jgi:MATE family multidrug resistance protein